MNQTASQPIAVTDTNFEKRVLQSDKPVLVDFWAAWCGPCVALGPVIEKLSDEYQGRATVAKVDIDSNQRIAAQFGIRSIPTVVLFDKGQIAETFVGVRPQSDYAKGLDKVLA